MNSDALRDLLESLSYRSNANLRPKGAVLEYTQEMVEEYLKCANDPIYFISNYIKVIHPDRGLVLMELYDYQERMIKAYHENKEKMNEGKPKEASHIDAVNALPVIGK